jgi:threonine aldolase/endonuclease/exonuclease/phosphatase family metal-dependent hydrolase
MMFGSDNWAGAAPEIVQAISQEAARFGNAYGDSPIDKAVDARFTEIFERDVAVFFVATGTAANALGLASVNRPGGVVFCHAASHVIEDECGAVEYLTGGSRLLGVDGAAGKLDLQALRAAMRRFAPGFVHSGQPMAVSITQMTEAGTVYTPTEIRAIAELAAERGLPLHMDGARFANALVSLGVSPAEMTWKAGIDILSFGGTKNGCMGAEALVFFDPQRAADAPYLRKRAGQLFSKSRFIAAQFDAYLQDGLWLELARHANGMADCLRAGLGRSNTAREAWPTRGKRGFRGGSSGRRDTAARRGRGVLRLAGAARGGAAARRGGRAGADGNFIRHARARSRRVPFAARLAFLIAGTAMRVMSLNGWGGKLHERLISYLHADQPDLLCLQEVVRSPQATKDWLTYRDGGHSLPQRANFFRDVAMALPDHLATFCPAAQGVLWDQNETVPSQWGLATFVHGSLPVTAQAQGFVHKSFSAHGYGAHPRSRCAHVVKVYDYARDRAVCVGHMHGLRDPSGKMDTPERLAQARKLADLVMRVAEPGDPLIVCGDFNVEPESETFAVLAEIGLTELVTTGGFQGTRSSHYPKAGRFADYMLVNQHVEVRAFTVVTAPEVSDHCPLVLEI